MEQLEGTAASVLSQLDQFYTGVKHILAEDVPVGAKTEKLRQLREKVLSEIQALVGDFDHRAQDKEKDLMDQMARLRQLRDHVTVIRHGVLPMFAYQPPRD